MRILTIFIYLLITSINLSAQNLDYSKLTRNVFEVVILKPSETDLGYEEELPTELIPFAEKNEKYLSVGTAFSIGNGKFVSAAHVFSVEKDTLFKAPQIRDSTGKVYAVGNVIAFSHARDYIVFEIPGLETEGLKIVQKPELNTRVYSVGNALGEGVVVRDGLFTSMTAEQLRGEWSWIRFSAPASPGNSGGPLINQAGEVLGIIEMKSQNENLNYALPMSEINYNNKASYNTRLTYGLPMFEDREIGDIIFDLNLPQSFEDLHKNSNLKFSEQTFKIADKVVLGKNNNRFPNAQNAEKLFYGNYYSSLPMLAKLNSDKSWQWQSVPKVFGNDIEDLGYLEFGFLNDDIFANLTLNDKVNISNLSANPDQLVNNFFLNAYAITRNFYGKTIRITSIGKKDDTSNFTDQWGRKWQIYTYNLGIFDSSFIFIVHFTPNGAKILARSIPQYDLKAYLYDFKQMCNYFHFAYTGSLEQWKNYLKSENVPSFLQNTSIKFEAQKENPNLNIVDFANSKFKLQLGNYLSDLKTSVLEMTKDSEIALTPSFYFENGNPVYDITRVTFKENQDSYLNIYKQFNPNLTKTIKDKSYWEKLINKKYPFDGSVWQRENESGFDIVSIPTTNGNSSEKLPYAYDLSYSSQDFAKAKKISGISKTLLNSLTFQKSEYFLLPGETLANLPSNEKIESLNIFDAIKLNPEVAQKFIDKKIDMKTKNDLGQTALSWAVIQGRYSLMANMISSGYDYGEKDKLGNIAIDYLLTKNYPTLEDLKLLWNYHKEFSENSIFAAIKNMNGSEIFELFKLEEFVGKKNQLGQSCLAYAIINAKYDIVDFLLKNLPEKEFQVVDKEGNNLIIYAIKTQYFSLIPELIKHIKLDPKFQNSKGWNYLHFASEYGDDLFEQLIPAIFDKIDIEQLTMDGNSALLLALKHSNFKIVKALISKGASLDQMDLSGLLIKDTVNYKNYLKSQNQ